MSPRPFRFSLQVTAATSLGQWRDQAKEAADLGFSILKTADHLDQCVSPLAPLVAAADAAPGLRVGTLVLNNDFRHPSLLAREAAAIDLLTDGRLELGLGAGHAQAEYERNGFRFDAPGTRIARLAESIQILRQLLDGNTVSFHGEHYDLDGEACYPRATQRHLPMLVGGGGNKTLAVAAQWADTVGLTGLGRTLPDGNRHDLSGFHPDVVTEQVHWVRHCAKDRAAHIELHALVQAVVVTDRPDEAVGRFRALAPEMTTRDLLATPYLLVGTVDGLTESILARRERWGISHYTVRPAALPAFGPVVAALAGR